MGNIESTWKLGQLYDMGDINRGSIGTRSIINQWRKLRITRKSPKFILITQPMDGIYSAPFEGDTTQHIPNRK